jgi:hypothetical protein
MKHNEFLPTFKRGEHKDELEIHTDLNGLENLIDGLNKLLKSAEKGMNDHTYLMTEEWGGYELCSESQGGEILNHIKIHCRNKK